MEYCGIELTEEGLQHYGVKGMHWGVRRYQPYPGEGRMTRRHAKKAVRIINSNAKRNAIKGYYKDESVKAYQIYMQKAKEAMRDNKDKKASKQLKKAGKEMADIMTLDKQIKSGKDEMNKALKNLNENGYKTIENTKVKRFADLGRTITDLFTPAGAIGVAETTGPNGSQTGAGPAIIQRSYIKTKLQKTPKTTSSQDRIDNAYKKAESIRIGYGAGSVDMSHPAVKWAIKDAKKKGIVDPEEFIKREGEPPRHDDWAQVILDYEKYNKKKKN